MSSVDFNPQEKVIRVPTRLWGPAKELVALLLLDTGAEGCVLNEKFMIEMGYDLTAAPETMSLITVGGIVEAPPFGSPESELLVLNARPSLSPVIPHPQEQGWMASWAWTSSSVTN